MQYAPASKITTGFEQNEQLWDKTMLNFLKSINAEIAGQTIGVLKPERILY